MAIGLVSTKKSIESFPFSKFGATKCRLSKKIVTEPLFYRKNTSASFISCVVPRHFRKKMIKRQKKKEGTKR